LNTVHEAFSLGWTSNQTDNAIMTTPKALAVTKYIIPNWLKKNGSTLNITIINVVPAMTLTETFSDDTTGSIGTLALV